MTAVLLLALAADVELAIDHAGRTHRVGLRVDGASDLRVEVAPASPHSAALTAALRDTLGGRAREADAVLLRRFDADGDGCLTPLEVVPDLLTRPAPPTPVAVRAVPAAADPPATVRLRLGAGERTAHAIGPVRIDCSSPDRGEGRGATLTVRPQARGWFEVLDADGDGQLSTRELRRAADRLTHDDLSPPGAVVSLTLARGTGAAGTVPLTPRPARRGPAWFRATDRNGDGDVSRAEFLGTDAEFRAFDADGDGLIDAAEAERGKP